MVSSGSGEYELEASETLSGVTVSSIPRKAAWLGLGFGFGLGLGVGFGLGVGLGLGLGLG